MADATPALLVPLTVEALTLVGASDNAAWSWASPSYGFLRWFKPVDAAPFTSTHPQLPGVGPFTGAVLHWALPDGTTHGTQTGTDGPVVYPAIPNRWFVARTAPDPGDLTRWQSTAWVVASDVVGDRTGSPFPNAAGDGATTLGRSWPLADWPGEAGLAAAVAADGAGSLSAPLTAVGSGDATYAAYVPNVASVVGFADPLTGLRRGPVTYEVIGWYSDPALDPLLGTDRFGPGGWTTVEDWQQLMRARRWSVGDDADLANAVAATAAWAAAHGQTVDPQRPRTTHPARTLCHGLLSDVTWLGPDGPLFSSVPTASSAAAGYVRPKVALGHNAIDALAAVIADAERGHLTPEAIRKLVDILQAFQHDDLALLDASDMQAQLDVLVQEGWYAMAAGGTQWTVAAAASVQDPRGQQLPSLDAAQRAALTTLERRQRDLDEAARVLAGDQATFAAACWKVTRIAKWGPPPPLPLPDGQQQAARAALATATDAVLASVGAYRFCRQARDTAFVALRGELDRSTTPLEVRAKTGAPFAAPTDPVLLVTGAHRAFKHGEDDRFTDDGTLFCRLTGQTIDGIEVDTGIGPGVLVDASKVPVPTFSHAGLPQEVDDLLVEGFFLDTGNAPLIARAAAPTGDAWRLLGRIRAEQTLIWNPAAHPTIDIPTITEASWLRFVEDRGAIPSKVGVSLWSPPWAPLFVDWSVAYFPGAVHATDALDPWQAPADRTPAGEDDLTFTWRDGRSPTANSPTTVQGRTVLTPQATDVLALRLLRAIDSLDAGPAIHDDLWALLLVLDHVRNADVLSQAMSGFGDALIQQFAGNFRLPDGPSVDACLRPDGAPAWSPSSIPDVTPGAPFSPIRGGHLRVDKLWVVDGFGQVFDVLTAMPGPPQAKALVCAPDLVTARHPELGELKPRIGQASRLDLDWLDAADDACSVGTDADADPICGWLVPNHLDRSLLVYASDGSPLGEVLTTADAARWLPAPGSAGPPHGGGVPPIDIDNHHLRAIVTGLVDRPDSLDALTAMLGLIDRASWAIDPTGGWPDAELPLLIGRPLVVGRAGLRLELRTTPAIRQGWDASGKDDSDGFPTVAFPVQLGSTELLDDGLVGFFLDDDYSHIDTVIGLLADTAAPGPSGPPYVQYDRPVTRADGATAALLTLLLDPHSTVHAITGTLPVTSVTLPPGLVDDALSRLAVTFRTGPLLGNDTGIAMPLPALLDGEWSWLEYDDTLAPARSFGVSSQDAAATLLDALPTFREGWLQLMLHGPPTRFAYSVVPDNVRCTTDERVPSTAALQLSAYNRTGSDVPCPRITWTLPVGTAPTDLASTAATIAPTVLTPVDGRWKVRADGVHVIAEPSDEGGGLRAGETMIVLVAGVQITTTPGLATVVIVETTDKARDHSLAITKLTGRPP